MTGLEIVGVALVAIVAAGLGLACWAQRREIDRLRHARALANAWFDLARRRRDALEAIVAATETGKSGTARKVHRMASEALAEQERIAANG